MIVPTHQYGVILTDPPWQYEMFSDKGYEKSPDAHYDCMTYEQLAAMRDEVLFSTAPAAVCFMWTTWPKLDEGMRLMRAWGFTYKTGGSWHKRSKRWTPGTKNPKTHMGTGYILRSASEPFLIGTVGEPKAKNRATRNIIEAAVREHSRKPECTYTMLEQLFEGPYLEMFARQQKPGWDSWGNQTDKFKQEAA